VNAKNSLFLKRLDAVAADTKDTDLGYRWRLNVGSGEAKELREILSKFGSSRTRVGNFHSFGSVQVRIFRRRYSSSRKP